MTGYRTEDEQIEAIKGLWKRYGNIITIVFSCALLVIAGTRYWNWHTEKVSTEASNVYERMMLAFSEHDTRNVQAFANTLVQDHGSSVYADAARLTLARVYVGKQQLDKARDALEYVGAHSRVAALRQVAKIRLSRVLAAQKQYDSALAALGVTDDAAFLPVIHEIRGDIYAATGHVRQAIASYQKAIREVKTQGMGNLFLEMKTSELAALTEAGNNTSSSMQSAEV